VGDRISGLPSRFIVRSQSSDWDCANLTLIIVSSTEVYELSQTIFVLED